MFINSFSRNLLFKNFKTLKVSNTYHIRTLCHHSSGMDDYLMATVNKKLNHINKNIIDINRNIIDINKNIEDIEFTILDLKKSQAINSYEINNIKINNIKNK